MPQPGPLKKEKKKEKTKSKKCKYAWKPPLVFAEWRKGKSVSVFPERTYLS